MISPSLSLSLTHTHVYYTYARAGEVKELLREGQSRLDAAAAVADSAAPST